VTTNLIVVVYKFSRGLGLTWKLKSIMSFFWIAVTNNLVELLGNNLVDIATLFGNYGPFDPRYNFAWLDNFW